MKYLILFVGIISINNVLVGQNKLDSDEVQLKYLKEVEWPKAYYDQDTILLDRILGDEFKMIDAKGKTYTKKDELKYIKSNKPTYKSFKFEITRLEILENMTAIVSGKGVVENTDKEGNEYIMTYWSSNILIKRGELWKAVSSHVSGINKKYK